jgi:hypothetical protein
LSLTKYIYDTLVDEEEKACPLISYMRNTIQDLMNSAVTFASSPDFEDITEDNETIAELMTNLLSLLTVVSQDETFFEIYQQRHVELIVTLCLNCMRTSKSEFATMFNDSEEFVNLALDTCDKQESECIKTKAASLLEAMCDNIDGSVTTLVQFSTNALNYSLQGQDLTQVNLMNMQNDPFITSTPPAIIAETCIVALTVVSYIVPKREDLVPLF